MKIKTQKNILSGNYYIMIKGTRAFICGIRGYSLKKNEISFLKKYKPWGVILFSRNIKSIEQTQNLTNSIKKILVNQNYPILIDEEGGRISRLKKFIDNSIFSAKYFGDLYKKDRQKFDTYLTVYIKQISYLLRLIGVNINTVPVLDLHRKKSHKIVGDRSYSSNKKLLSKIGDIAIDKFHQNRIGTVMKHIPGHGLAKVDSHYRLPNIDKDLKYLKQNDFYPFFKKKAILGMTGHLLFKKLDPINNVSHSKIIINLIRNKILFKGLLMTDDISMGALNGHLKNNVRKSFNAGCNLVLHCNGMLNEMNIVAKNSPFIDDFITKKTSKLIQIIS